MGEVGGREERRGRGGRGKGREEEEGEVGAREREEGRGGTGGENVVCWCGLAVAQDLKRAAAKELAAACFGIRRYC